VGQVFTLRSERLERVGATAKEILMSIVLRSPTLERWISKNHPLVVIILFFLGICAGSYIASLQPKDYALVDGVYYENPYRCNFGVLEHYTTRVLDINDEPVACVEVYGKPSEIRKLGQIK
jgi:hypothetical protein